ncbi:hypothetical protein GWK26_13670 [haloarchaeon 3A1-DGR]|nr:hypothetical protein GWK26_13670 [haloarchaeon 3A1-DGR]
MAVEFTGPTVNDSSSGDLVAGEFLDVDTARFEAALGFNPDGLAPVISLERR